ncbi:hypothetical protein PF005_g23258 [Phytophthora fragariae]|uniref:Uncharacterized protein n=1 Tax=Phytophthora fragariae TaxID=53985 RepID=A0A6A3WUJ5_9STRA|nr:hypothetical protein PF005_g23258 [Phytophthora fragariae]KAE9191377.1 hypothetical protein PF002_g24513 [Phytophthora fragariae]
MNFMVPAGIHLDLADGSVCLPDEVKIQLSGRRQLYNDKARMLRLDQHSQVNVGESVEIPLRFRASDQEKLWLTRGDRWVRSLVSGPVKIKYVEITNISDPKIILQRDERIGLWLAGDRSDRDAVYETPLEPAVKRPSYPTPRAILKRNPVTVIVQDKSTPAGNAQVSDPIVQAKTESIGEVATPEQIVEAVTGLVGEVPISESITKAEPPGEVPIAGPIVKAEPPGEVPIPEQIVEAETGLVEEVPISESITKAEPPGEVPIPEQIVEAETGVVREVPISESTAKPGLPEDTTATDQAYFHEGGGVSAEDFERELAVIPEIVISLTDEVSIEDIKVGDLTMNTPEEIDRLRQMIWRKKHLLIGKGNAPPPPLGGRRR